MHATDDRQAAQRTPPGAAPVVPRDTPERTANQPFGRGIVLYDFLHCRGGAERVTLDLARGTGADVGVAFRRLSEFPDATLAEIACREFLPAWAPQPERLKAMLSLLGFRHRAGAIADYDWAVFSGSTTPAAWRYRPAGGNLYYCHTIPRLAYDLYDWYRDRLPRWQRPAFAALAGVIRQSYAEGMGHMDRVLANSETVRARLAHYLGIDAQVVWPPCDTGAYAWTGQDGYYLSTARLEPFKRVDAIVEAFRRLPGKRLVVASGGSDAARLRALAADAPNITFVGWQDEAAFRRLVGSAIATVYVARDEDFGMSPVESMAAGKPVIAVREGGLRETVVDGETGLLLDPPPTGAAIAAAVGALPPERAASMRAACEARAGLFGRERFLQTMQRHIGEVASAHARSRELQ